MQVAYPKHLMIELTDRCNLKCMICIREEYEEGIGSPGTMMALDDVLKLENPIRHAEVITITGFGETFLHPDLKTILDRIYEINPADNLIKIVTNGTALGADKAPWFAGHLNTLSISLNSSNPDAYAREMHPYEVADGRDVSNKFTRLVDKIVDFANHLSPEDRRKVHLHYVVHRENVRDMVGFVELTHKMGLSQVHFTHFKVHRERNIKSSIYWAKDEYNDAFDEATHIGRTLGVGVGGRKFFTEEPKVFVAERDCTWPIDTSIVTVKGTVVPCCYWSGDDHTGNAFSEKFDDVWFGEFYENLRKKRDATPCSTCNILHTFDDVILHFSPFLKSTPAFAESMERYQELSNEERQAIRSRFDEKGLDMSFHKWVLRQIGRSFETSETPVLDAERAILAHFSETETEPQSAATIDLSSRFIGTGWGRSEQNQHQQSWRWIGGGGASSVFLHLAEGARYRVQIAVHNVNYTAALESVRIKINGQEIPSSNLHYENDSYHVAFEFGPDEMQGAGGKTWISIVAAADARIAFSRMVVTEKASVSLASRVMDPYQMPTLWEKLRRPFQRSA